MAKGTDIFKEASHRRKKTVPIGPSGWKRFTGGYRGSAHRQRQDDAQRASGANGRGRCKIIENLVRGESTTVIACSLGTSRSQVCHVAKRFLREGLPGLADRPAPWSCSGRRCTSRRESTSVARRRNRSQRVS
ncbi:MAG: helix-turn-helix domain-containing protein [Planctomycetes bacterium]|nr:helix-turn-helix domain-containing protein [Planctomycetota bacterium]